MEEEKLYITLVCSIDVGHTCCLSKFLLIEKIKVLIKGIVNWYFELQNGSLKHLILRGLQLAEKRYSIKLQQQISIVVFDCK
jgi:hypothetical protein